MESRKYTNSVDKSIHFYNICFERQNIYTQNIELRITKILKFKAKKLMRFRNYKNREKNINKQAAANKKNRKNGRFVSSNVDLSTAFIE